MHVAEAKASPNRAYSQWEVDAKLCDLPMVRMKVTVTRTWRSEPVNVEKFSDELWVGVKG